MVLGAGFLERQSANRGDIRMVVGSYLVWAVLPFVVLVLAAIGSLYCPWFAPFVVSVVAVVVCGSS